MVSARSAASIDPIGSAGGQAVGPRQEMSAAGEQSDLLL